MGEGKEHFYGFVSSASGSSANGNPGLSRSNYKTTEGPLPGFDFTSDDLLSSYDYNKKQNFTDHYVAPSRLGNSSADSYMSNMRSDRQFRESRTAKPYANEQLQEEDSRYNEVIGTVERTMKKYADNLLKVLDGMSSRLSQLELVNERLERSIGEMRADMEHDHNETGERFRMLENHLREVHRTVQIMRDKQEIAEAQTELAKLQLARKESSSNLHGSEDKSLASSTLSEVKQDHTFQPQNVQAQHRSSHPALPALPALPAPQQPSPSHSLPMPTPEQCQPSLSQQQQPAQGNMMQQSPVTPFPQVVQSQQQPNVMVMQPYPPQQPQQQGQIQQVSQGPQIAQLPYAPQPPVPQTQNLQYTNQPPHIQNVSNQSSQPHVQRTHAPQMAQLQPQSQLQLQPQPQMQLQPLSQQTHLSQQAHMRPNVYPGQTHGASPEAFSYASENANQQTQPPYQVGSSEASTYNYGSPAHFIQPSSQGQLTMQLPRPQLNQGVSQTSDGGSASSALVPLPAGHPMHGFSAYNLPPRPPSGPYGVAFSVGPQANPFPGAYTRFPSPQQAQQYAQPSANAVPNTGGGHLPSTRAFDELIEQVAGMGFSRDQIRSVIQRLTESGQPVDMNSVLDRLNNTTGPSQRGWYN